jgi:hypothetical protein
LADDLIDVNMINAKFEEQGFDLKVKPVGDSSKLYWFCAKDNSVVTLERGDILEGRR